MAQQWGQHVPWTPVSPPDSPPASPAAPSRPPLHERRAFPYLVMGASWLALIAGYCNAYAFVTYQLLVSHVTGTVSKSATNLASGDLRQAGILFMLALSFCMGSAMSGFALKVRGANEFWLGRSYGNLILLCAALLIFGDIIAEVAWPPAGVALWAAAMGCQNALCTSYSGAVVRTTHMTGLVTDVGLVIGQYLRYKVTPRYPRPPVWKLGLLVPLLVFFFIGGLIGYSNGDEFVAGRGILIAAAALAILGVWYNIMLKRGDFDHIDREPKDAVPDVESLTTELMSEPSEGVAVEMKDQPPSAFAEIHAVRACNITSTAKDGVYYSLDQLRTEPDVRRPVDGVPPVTPLAA